MKIRNFRIEFEVENGEDPYPELDEVIEELMSNTTSITTSLRQLKDRRRVMEVTMVKGSENAH